MKQLLILITAILLIPLASSLSDDLINEMVNSIVFASWYDINVTQDNSTYDNQGVNTGVVYSTSDCVVENCADFDDAGDKIVWSDIPEYNAWTNVTIKCWEKNNMGANGEYFTRASADDSPGTWRWMARDGVNQVRFISAFTGGAGVFSDINVLSDNTWNMVTVVYNKTESSMDGYFNATRSDTDALGGHHVVSTDDLWQGLHEFGAGNEYIGKLDECEIYNMSLTSDQIEYLFDENVAGRHILAIPPDVTPPTITVWSPTNNTRVNDLPLNFTLEASDDSAGNINCTLSNETVFFDNATSAQTTRFNLSFTSAETEINQMILFNISCVDLVSNQKTDLFNITIDTINPAIVITDPINNTLVDRTAQNLTFNSLCTDVSPLAYNVSMINSDGVVILSFQNNSPNINELQLKNEFNISGIPLGEYVLNFTCVDSHTYSVSKITDVYKDEILKKLYYTTESTNDVSIQFIESNLNLCDFHSYPLPDREVFVYDFSCNKEAVKENYYKFMLRDNYGKLKYLPKSKYKAHFVTKENFITFDLDKASYTIQDIGKDYLVTVWTDETYLEFKNSIGGLNKEIAFLNVQVKETNYTALRHFDFNVNTILIDSFDFLTVFNGTINFTSTQMVIFRGSGQAKKLQAGSATVRARLRYLDNIIMESDIVTISGTTDRLSFNLGIVNATSNVGSNNFSLEISEDGLGAVNLTRVIVEAEIDQSNKDNDVAYNTHNTTTTYASTTFIEVFNVTLDKTFNASTMLDIHHTFGKEGGGDTTPTCYAESNLTGITPSYTRYLSGASDVGISGITFRSGNSTGFEKWTLYCRSSDTDTITNIISMFAMEMIDSSGNVINGFQNQTSSVLSLTAGTTKILSADNYVFRNASELDFAVTVIIQSTSGSQDGVSSPVFKFNSSNIEDDDCSRETERGLSGNSDIGTVKFYYDCETTPGILTNFSLYATVASGETLNIINASITGYEVDESVITVINVPPLVVIQTPAENAELNEISSIQWISSDLDNFTTNITIINSSDTVQVATDLGEDETSVLYNFTVLGDGQFTLNITSSENLTPELLSGTATRTFTVRLPAINITLYQPINNSELSDGNIAFQFITDTLGANCSLYINNVINRVNQSMNSTVGINTFGTVRIQNGSHNWLVRCRNETLSGVSNQFFFDITEIDLQAMDVRSCPTATAGVLLLILIVVIALFFIMLGIVSRTGVLGFFGAILLIITSWYIAPCIAVFAYILALFGGFLIIFFIARSFSANPSQ